MKKVLAIVAVLAFIASFAVFADDAMAPPAPSYTGSVGFTWGSADLDNNPKVFSNSSSGTVGSVKLGIDSDKVAAGVTIGLVPTITKVGGTDNYGRGYGGQTLAANSNFYSLASNVLNWYKGKQGAWDNGSKITYTATEAALLDYSKRTKTSDPSTYVTDFVTITTTAKPYTFSIADEPASYTTDYVSRVAGFFKAILDAELTDIATLATDSTTGADFISIPAGDWNGATAAFNGGTLDGYTVGAQDTSLTTGTYYFVLDNNGDAVGLVKDKDKFNDAVIAYKSVFDNVFGAYAADSWTAAYPISNAFITIKKIGGVVDLGLAYNKDATVGSMVTSQYTKPGNTDPKAGMSIGLSDGVIPGVSASVYVDTNAGTNGVGDNVETIANEDNGGLGKPVVGVLISGGYSTDMFGVKLGAMIGDTTAIGDNLAFSIQPSVTLADLFGLNVAGEFTMGRKNGDAGGFGAGVKVGATMMGISPAVTFKYKNAAFSGAGDSNLDGSDAISSSSASATFDSIDSADAAYFQLDASADLSSLIGMKLVSVNLGYQMMLMGSDYMGYSGGLSFDFNDVLKMPLTAGWSLSTYDNADNGTSNDFTLGYKIGAAALTAEYQISGTGPTNLFQIGAKVSF